MSDTYNPDATVAAPEVHVIQDSASPHHPRAGAHPYQQTGDRA